MNHTENDGEEVWRQERREVILRGVYPAEEEVPVAVGGANVFIEEVNGLLTVEICAYLVSHLVPGQREVSTVEAVNPVCPLCALDAFVTSAGEISALDCIELTILHPHGNGVVTHIGASAIHDEGVQTVESVRQKQVSRLDKVGINIYHLSLTLHKFHSHGLFKEVDVGRLHVGGQGSVDLVSFSVSATVSANEHLDGVNEGLYILNEGVAEIKGLDTLNFHVVLCLLGVHVVVHRGGAVREVDLNMVDLGVREKDSFGAGGAHMAGSFVLHIEGGFRGGLVGHGYFVEATAFVGSSRI